MKTSPGDIPSWPMVAAVLAGLAAPAAMPAAALGRSQPVDTTTPAPVTSAPVTSSPVTSAPVSAANTTTAPVEINPSRNVEQLAATLADGSIPQPVRDEAARRLLNLRSPVALDALKNSLAEQNPGGQIAVARALADDVQPDPAFVNPLFAALGANRAVTEAAAATLANYHDNGEVLRRLLDFATNRQRSNDVVRASVIRALGSFPEKRSAETLLNLLKSGDEPAPIRREAADALADLSGEAQTGLDAKTWEQWWSGQSSKSEQQFHTDLLNRRAAERNQKEKHIRQLSSALEASMRDQYQLTPANQREALLMRWLTSGEPEMRARAADQIREDFTEAKAFSDAILQQLRSMISDSSVTVRQRVTLAFATRNDPAALEPLLRQLAQERDPAVKLQIANALRNMNDVRAAPALKQLLSDPAADVSRAAMNAIKDVGETLQKQNPELANQVATSLHDIVDRTSSTTDIELRAAAVDALAPLHRAELMQTYFRLLKPQAEVARVRVSALNALGELHDHNASGPIIESIGDPDDTVTLAAVRALGKVDPTADQLENLWPLLNPDAPQRDASIRDAAWADLQSSLPTMNKEQLTRWADRFRADPQKRIAILSQLRDVQTADKDLDGLATTQHQIALDYMTLHQPDQAVPSFRAALEYRQSTASSGSLLEQLIIDYTNALLVSDKYDEAVAFATKTIQSDSARRGTFGPLICGRVEQLAQSPQPDQLKKGAKLAELAKQMQVPLGDQYVDRLDTAKKSIDKRLADITREPNGPRSANGSPNGLATPTTRPTGIAGGGD